MTREEVITALFDYYQEQSKRYPQMEYSYGFFDAIQFVDMLVKAEEKQ